MQKFYVFYTIVKLTWYEKQLVKVVTNEIFGTVFWFIFFNVYLKC